MLALLGSILFYVWAGLTSASLVAYLIWVVSGWLAYSGGHWVGNQSLKTFTFWVSGLVTLNIILYWLGWVCHLYIATN